MYKHDSLLSPFYFESMYFAPMKKLDFQANSYIAGS